MALAATTLFASFDITDGSQDRDISPVLAKALYYDLHALGAINVDFGRPVHDTLHYWNEDALNADTVTVSGSVTSSGSSIVLASAAQGARCHIGDILYDTAIAKTERMRITDVSSATLTVSRGINSTTATTIADAATLALIRCEQEGSDIGTDKSVAPTVRSNSTQIFSTNDLKITGTQLARKMATNEMQDFLALQLANRAIEMKINMTRALFYGEKGPSTGGSDTAYRSFNGINAWIRDSSGITDATSEAFSYSMLNDVNKQIVDKGKMPNLLLVGTDLVGSIAGFDSTYRRMRESDKQVGYMVNDILLNQGNSVQVVVDPRVKTGDAFLVTKEDISLLPMVDRGMVVIAATDFADAKKRRILGEWTLEYRNPEAGGYISYKT